VYRCPPLEIALVLNVELKIYIRNVAFFGVTLKTGLQEEAWMDQGI
jgi:hypothetical protein